MLKKKQNINNVIRETNSIFKEILENNNIQINYNTTSNDIPEWDSLGHIQLVIAIEKHFKIKFTASEIQKYNNVGEMCEAILQKINKYEKK